MSISILRQRARRDRQPAFPVINWGHPLTRGLVAWWSGSQKRMIVAPYGYSGGGTSLATPAVSARGAGLTFNGSNNDYTWYANDGHAADTSGKCSFFAVASPILNSTEKRIVGGKYNIGFGSTLGNIELNDSNRWRFQVVDDFGNVQNLVSTVIPVSGRATYLAAALDIGRRIQRIVVDGIVTSDTPPSSTFSNYGYSLGVLDRANGVEQVWDSFIGDAGWWNRTLTEAELVSMTTDPWQIFGALPRAFFTGSSFRAAYANINVVIGSGARAA